MSRERENFILQTDSYKTSHWKQYPNDTQVVYSYLESRGGKWNDTVFFGLQYILKHYFMDSLAGTGQVIYQSNINKAEARINAHMGPGTFNREGWQYIFDKYEGALPLSIWAVPEGTPVPNGHPLVVVYNTDPKCYWLTNYVETLLMQVWYPITVATQSREMKQLILKYLKRTGDPSGIDFKLHDFGYRGVSSCESAGLGGCAHLVNFKGTDTMAALEIARNYYGEEMAGFSIPAAEHSTITSWGREHEDMAYRNMLDKFPTGLVAVVSDSYNIFEACRMWGHYPLRDRVQERDGTVVIRPDSGDPVQVLVAGNENVLDILWEGFGGTVNDKGYKVLNPKVRIIQGDGVDIKSIDSILYAMQRRGYSADNIAFGSGGALLQRVDRDTLSMAFKCSAIQVAGKWHDVFKDPITQHGKQSKRGQVMTFVTRESGSDKPRGFRTHDRTTSIETCWDCGMVEVFRNGRLLIDQPLSDIRERAACA